MNRTPIISMLVPETGRLLPPVALAHRVPPSRRRRHLSLAVCPGIGRRDVFPQLTLIETAVSRREALRRWPLWQVPPSCWPTSLPWTRPISRRLVVLLAKCPMATSGSRPVRSHRCQQPARHREDPGFQAAYMVALCATCCRLGFSLSRSYCPPSIRS